MSSADVRLSSIDAGIDSDRVHRVAEQVGLRVDQVDDARDGVRGLCITRSKDSEDGERFELEIPEDASADIGLVIFGNRSLRYGLADLARRLESDFVNPGNFVQEPAFKIRGLIEGFYGRPWTSIVRLDMVRFAADLRFNTYLYSPKDDPYLRADWRVEHRDSDASELEAFIRQCAEYDVDSMIGVSPGLSISYANNADVQLLLDKIESIVRLGATRIALLFDDIPPRLQHPADVEAFATLAEAHGRITNRVAHQLAESGVPLVVCPTVYRGDGNDPYLRELGEALEPSVDIFFTGRDICAPAIQVAEAEEVARSIRRRPLFWDNYPVNDLSMSGEMHIGPYRHRDRQLFEVSEGVMANAMEYPEASKIPLATIADFLWNPLSYDEERSWNSAIERVVGLADTDSFLTFADASRGSCLAHSDPPLLARAFEDFVFAVEYTDALAARQSLHDTAAKMRASIAQLMSGDAYNEALQQELQPWFEVFELGCDAVEAVARFWPGTGSEVNEDALTEVLGLGERLRRSPYHLFGDVLQMTLDELISSLQKGHMDNDCTTK